MAEGAGKPIAALGAVVATHATSGVLSSLAVLLGVAAATTIIFQRIHSRWCWGICWPA